MIKRLPSARIGATEQRAARLHLLLITGAVVAAVAVLRLAPVDTTVIYLPCPWRALTGTWCPGCGSLRGLSAMVGGDPLGLWRNNVFAFTALPFLAWSYVALALQALFGYRPASLLLPRWSLLVLAGLIVAFGILRNLVPALAPRPI